MNSRWLQILRVISRAAPRVARVLLVVPAWASILAAIASAAPSLPVPSQFDRTVKEYDGTTGAFIRNIVGFDPGRSSRRDHGRGSVESARDPATHADVHFVNWWS